MDDSLLILSDEVLVYICEISHKRETCRLMRSCQRLYGLRAIIKFHGWVDLKNILHFPLYNSFTHVRANGLTISAMKRQKRALPCATTHLILQNFIGYLRTITRHLQFLTHLILAHSCKITVKPGCLPRTVTHLTWNIVQKLSIGVLHEGLLSLRITDYIYLHMVLPSTLQILHLKGCFTRIYSDMLPTGLLLLSLDGNVAFDKDTIPVTVKKMIFGKNFNSYQPIIDYIPMTVKTCIFWDNRLLWLYEQVDPAKIPQCRIKFIKPMPMYSHPDLTLHQAILMASGNQP